MDLEGAVLNKISQTEKGEHCIHIGNLKTSNSRKSRMVAAKTEGWERNGDAGQRVQTCS